MSTDDFQGSLNPTADVQTPPLCRPRLKREWELLEFRDGSLAFNSIYGKHMRLREPPSFLKETLIGLDGNRTVAELSHVAAGVDEPTLQSVLAQLRDAGIVEENAQAPRPAWLSDEVHARFYSYIDFLTSFRSPQRNEYDYFRSIRDSSVCVVGAGGTGSVCAMMLTAVGIGALTVIDADVVEESNLVRQFFYDEVDVGVTPKVDALTRRLRAFSRFTELRGVRAYIEREGDALSMLRGFDFVLLCADAPRVLLNRWVNRACVALRAPYANAFSGLVGPLYAPGESPCFECFERTWRARIGDLHDMMVDALQVRRSRQYPSSSHMPVAVGSMLAKECLGYLTGAWRPHSLDRALRIDYLGATGYELVPVDPDCPVCGPSSDGGRHA